MADKLVTIAQFTNYIEAELARQLLADYGIEAVATGQNASNIYSIPAVEGPELQVRQSQAQQAHEILELHKKSVDAAPDDAQEQ
ncbi:MAG: putative signal transducing protein [Phycisphaerae bacterium]